MDFVAIDVETANASFASICQIGLVGYEHGVRKDSWKSLINPQEYFDPFNVAIHGITEDDVEDAPTFPEVADTLKSWLEGRVAICHTPFDRAAMSRVSAKYGFPEIGCTWLDTAKVARRTWSDCAWRGYGLGDLAEKLGIGYWAHDAEEDARACAEVLLHALNTTGLGLAEWLERVKWPLTYCLQGLDTPPTSSYQRTHRDGNPDGAFYGDVLVFTGALRIPREEAADKAADVGFHVDAGVTKHTTMLVVGDQDITKLAGHEKSSKHRKAEELIAKGQPIRILCESDFQQLVQY